MGLAVGRFSFRKFWEGFQGTLLGGGDGGSLLENSARASFSGLSVGGFSVIKLFLFRKIVRASFRGLTVWVSLSENSLRVSLRSFSVGGFSFIKLLGLFLGGFLWCFSFG